MSNSTHDEGDGAVEWMRPEKRQEYYLKKVAELVQYAYANAPGVQELLDRGEVNPLGITSMDEFRKIPVTAKDEMLALQRKNPPFGGFLSVPIQEIEYIWVSPGPLYEAQGHVAEYDSLDKALVAAGMGKGDIIVNTFSYHLVPAGMIIDQAARSLGITVIPTGVGNTALQVQVMQDAKVTGFVGTPGFLLAILKKADEMGCRQDLTLKRAMVGGEKMPDALRESIEKDYGISVTQVYGTAELAMVAYECREKSGMHIAEQVLVEIVDPQTNETLGPNEVGQVVVTSFHRAYCLIRFGTGDLSRYTDEPCACGRTSPRLVALEGRVGEAVKVRGMFIHPRQIGEVMSKYPQVACYQLVVSQSDSRDKLTLNVEISNDSTDRVKLSEDLREQLQDVCRLKIDEVEYLAGGTIPEDAKPLCDMRI